MIGARKNLARRGWAVAAVGCLTITLAACQGDGPGEESPDPTTPETDPAPAPNSPDPESSEGSDPGGFKPPVISPYDPAKATPPAECASIEWKDGATVESVALADCIATAYLLAGSGRITLSTSDGYGNGYTL